MKKSQIIGLFLTLAFGPIGLFYSSVPAALGFLSFSAGLLYFFASFGFFFLPRVEVALIVLVAVWVVSVMTGLNLVSIYNDQVDLAEKRHKEMLDALWSIKGESRVTSDQTVDRWSAC